MMGKLVQGWLCALLCLSAVALGIETKQQQIVALEAVLAELQTHYGMEKFKAETFGVTLEGVRTKYTRLIHEAVTLEEDAGLVPAQTREVLPPDEFRQLLIGLGSEFRDGHTNILRQSTRAWTLGLRAAGIDGRLFITGFDKTYFSPEMTYPQLEAGDEVVAVDGRPVEEIAKEKILYTQTATYENRRHRALERILSVSHRWQRPLEDGAPVRVTFAKTDSNGKRGETFEATLHWTPTIDAEQIRGMYLYLPNTVPPKAPKPPYVFGDPNRTESYFNEGLKKLKLPTGSITDIGKLFNTQIAEAKDAATKGLPHDEKLKELKPIERLAVYTVRYKGKSLGVIRIPDYSPESFGEVIAEMKWLYALVGMLENTTDALVIDQNTNGGGYVFHFSHFVRMFAGQGPISTGTMDAKMSETFLRSYESIGTPDSDALKHLEGVRRSFGSILLDQKRLAELREKFEKGERWTGQSAFYEAAVKFAEGEQAEMVGVKNSVYTKPLLILNDQRSGSGGDFMPATLQANGRAIVFGETSAGLGGPVYRSQDSMPGSEMFMRCTLGFCLRKDGLPIENLGVVPDIERRVTPKDLKEGFVGYAREALDVALQLSNGRQLKNLELPKTAAVVAGSAAAVWNRRIEQFRVALDQTEGWRELEDLYRSFFTALRSDDVLKDAASDASWVALPLPRKLLEQDILLAGLNQRDEVIDRLTDLQGLSRYSEPEMQTFLHTLIVGLSERPRVEIARCSDLLRGNRQ